MVEEPSRGVAGRAGSYVGEMTTTSGHSTIRQDVHVPTVARPSMTTSQMKTIETVTSNVARRIPMASRLFSFTPQLTSTCRAVLGSKRTTAAQRRGVATALQIASLEPRSAA